MGFPAGYSELPNILLHALLLLGYVRRLISWAFDSLGLGDLLDDGSALTLETPARVHTHHHRQRHPPLSALIEDAMPAVQFAELGRHADGCAVCLHEFEGAEEVRRLRNCCHVFHRRCLDPWMEHGQRTCPLCRASLFPADVQPISDSNATAAGVSDLFLADFPSLASSPTPLFSQHFFTF